MGATTIIYEGKPVGTPDPGAFWRVISEHRVKALFTAPTAFRAIKREDPQGNFLKPYDISKFEALFLAGERLDPDTYFWASELLKRPVIDHWWQTETGWAIAGNFLGLEYFPIKPGSATKPMPGYNIKILDPSTGQELGPNQNGVIAVKLPLPPANLPTLWKDDQRFLESYMNPFPGYYLTGDGGYMDEDGYVFVMGRVDDVINVAGHRLSTGGMEEVLARHPDVAECAVIGAGDDLKGQVPVGFVVLKSGVTRSHGGNHRRDRSRWSERISVPWPLLKKPWSLPACPKPDREKSSAAPCEKSPTANPIPSLPPSTIRSPWMKSARP